MAFPRWWCDASGMAEKNSRAEDLAYGIFMLIAGVLLILLPMATWRNSVFFAILFSPGFLLGPYLLYGSIVFFRDAAERGKD